MLNPYATLINSFLTAVTIIVSICAIVFSSKNANKEVKAVKEESRNQQNRYEEQRKQYEERLNEERKQREEDKREVEEKLRVSEEPYLVFKNSKVVSNSTSEQTILHIEFLNKGRGAAYCIIPDLECTAKRMNMTEFIIHRCEAVQDPIAMVGEIFVMVMSYNKDEKDFFKITPTIKFEDASGRKYKQTFCIDIVDRLGKGMIINYAQPELC